MTPLFRVALTAATLAGATPARAADFPAAPYDRGPAYGAPSGGGYRVARVPVRPAPWRYDVYGYPLLADAPSPLAPGGCPSALQPVYDTDGNLAGYGLVPMCR